MTSQRQQVQVIYLRHPKVLDAIVAPSPPVTAEAPQHLCADAGYAGEPVRQEIDARDDAPHVWPRGEEIDEKGRWCITRRDAVVAGGRPPLRHTLFRELWLLF